MGTEYSIGWGYSAGGGAGQTPRVSLAAVETHFTQPREVSLVKCTADLSNRQRRRRSDVV